MKGLIYFLFLYLEVLAIDDKPITKTSKGVISGIYQQSTFGRKYASFEGVPYAEAPVGELRFKESIPKKPWKGIWEANIVHQCLQINHEPKNLYNVEGSEDCLYLNIYTPSINPSALLPIIIHFHSGAFMWGRGDIYGAKHLMDQNVVYVNLNYRLGPLGFISTGDNVLPGNLGLKDQNLALQWVQEHIDKFGGDKKSVTITGLSAGGASTHYHLLSPLSKGLFHRAISVSGCALDNWAFVENATEKAWILGRALGCDWPTSTDLAACLRQRSAQQIIRAVKLFQPWLYNPYTVFGPVVDSQSDRPFLPATPWEIIESGKVADVPWITSVTSEDGLYPAAQFIYKKEWLPELEKNWFNYAPHIFHFHDTVSKEFQTVVSQQIKDYYLHGKPISRETYSELVQAIGDRLFVVDSEKAAKIQAKINKSPVYYYYFSYRGDHSYSEYFTGTEENIGVSHADDLMYIMYPDPSWFTTYMKSNNDKKMSKILIDMWMSFIKTNVPTLPGIKTWEPVSKNYEDKLKYVYIAGPDDISVETAVSIGHSPFWNSLPFHENEKLSLVKDEL